MRPFSAWVCALNALQNSMMLTPCCPSAGPTGGAGLACPAGICSLIWPVTFFAIAFLCLFHLPILQFHWRIAPKNIHRDFQFSTVRFDLLDHPAEIQERPVIDL